MPTSNLKQFIISLWSLATIASFHKEIILTGFAHCWQVSLCNDSGGKLKGHYLNEKLFFSSILCNPELFYNNGFASI